MEQWQGTALLTGEILSVWLHHHHCSLCISIISPIRHIYSNIKREMKGYIIFLMYNIYYTPIPLTAQMKPDKAACGDRSKVILSLLNRPTTTLCDGREIIVTVITPISRGRTPRFRGVKWFSLGSPPGLVKAGLVLKTFHLILWDPYIAGCLWGCIHSFTHLLICLVYIEWVPALGQVWGARRNLWRRPSRLPALTAARAGGFSRLILPRQHCTKSGDTSVVTMRRMLLGI